MGILDRWFPRPQRPAERVDRMASLTADARKLSQELNSPTFAGQHRYSNDLSSLVESLAEEGIAAVPVLLEIIEARPAHRAAGDGEHGFAAAAAAKALGTLRYAGAAPIIAPLLSDPNHLARCEAATALGLFGSTAAVPALVRALKDHDEVVRSEVVKALASIGDRSVTGDIEPLLRDVSGFVRTAAAETLARLHWQTTDAGLRAASAIARRDMKEVVAAGPAALPALLLEIRSQYRARGKHGHESGRHWTRIMDEMKSNQLPDSGPIQSALEAIQEILAAPDVVLPADVSSSLANLPELRVMHYGPVHYYDEGSGNEGETYKRHETLLYTRSIRLRVGELPQRDDTTT